MPALVLVWILRADGDTRGATPIAPGDAAPAFTLPTLDGGELALGDLAGTPVVVTFFASWCVPCEDEMPVLSDALARRPGEFEVVAVTFQDDPGRARAFLERHEAPFPAVHDADLEVARRYGVRGIPVTFFVAPDGSVVDRVFGITTHAAFTEPLERLLAVPTPTS